MDLVEINPKIEESLKKRKRFRGEERYNEELSETVGMGIDLVVSLFKKYLSI